MRHTYLRRLGDQGSLTGVNWPLSKWRSINTLFSIEDITRWREDMNFIFEWHNNILRTSAASSKILFLPRENKVQIFKPPCNDLLLYRQNDIDETITKITSSINSRVRLWKINHSGPRCSFMNFTSGIFSSKTLGPILSIGIIYCVFFFFYIPIILSVIVYPLSWSSFKIYGFNLASRQRL